MESAAVGVSVGVSVDVVVIVMVIAVVGAAVGAQSPLLVLRPLLLNVQTTQMVGLIAMGQLITVHGIVWVPIVPNMATAMQTIA